MAIKKTQSQQPQQKKPKEKLDPRIEEVYEEEVTFTCPVRGIVKQKVKIKRFKTLGEVAKSLVPLNESPIDKIEEQDDGLSIYGATDEETTE